MFQESVLNGFLVLILVFALVLAPSAYAGKVEYTTYYPSAYGEYTTLKSASDSYFATASGSVGIGTATPAGKLHVYTNAGATVNIDSGDGASSKQSSVNLLTLGTGAAGLGAASSKGWTIVGRGNGYTTAGEQNDLIFAYWNGTSWLIPLAIDSLTGAMTGTLSAPGVTLQTVYKTWSTTYTSTTLYTYLDMADSDLTITAKKSGSIFKITVISQGYSSGGVNIGIKYLGTSTLIAGADGALGDIWRGSCYTGADGWSITRVQLHNPGAVAGNSYTYRAMYGVYSGQTWVNNYPGYSGSFSTITIEEIAT